MGTFLKWLFGSLFALVVLLVAAVIILPMVVDPNDYKPQIVAAAEEQLGRTLEIDQDLNLTVFPWLGLETGGVRLGNAEGFSDRPFAEVANVAVRVKLIPLLSRQVEVDTLVLEGLAVSLEKDAQGNTNWAELTATQASPEPAGESQDGPGPGDTGDVAQALSVNVQGIQVEDARISWDDRQAGQRYVVDGVRIVTGSLSPGADVPVEIGMQFRSEQPAMTLAAELVATVGTDADLAVFRIPDLSLQLDAEGEGLPSGGARLALKADVEADLPAGTVRVARFSVEGPAMSASGDLGVEGLQTEPVVSGRLAIDETSPKTLAAMFATPIETVDPEALTRAAGEFTFSYANGALKLDPLALTLDDSSLSGHVHLLDPAGPVVRADLALDAIDLDRYMPPAAGGATAEGKASPAPSGDPFAALRSLDLQADFRIGQLTVNKARMSNVSARVVSSNGVLEVDPMGADLYEGRFNGSVVLDARDPTPKVAVKNALTGIQVGPLLRDVAGEDRLVGKGEVHADIRVVGLTEAEIRRSLSGNARFAFNDGAFKGVNIAQIVRQGSQALGLSGAGTETGTPGQTDFTELSGSFDMANGVIRNQDLRAQSPLLRIEGEGTVDLPQDSVDYLVVTTLVNSLEGQGGRGSDELAGIPIPVRVTGPLAQPSYRPDLEAALTARAEAEIEARKEELRQRAEEKIQDQVGDALRGLFGR
jgi:AsmA protein